MGTWLACILVLCSPLIGTAAATSTLRHFDLPVDTAETSLKRFSKQSKLDVLFVTQVAAGVKTNAIKGEFTPMAAMERILADTGLVATWDEVNSVLLVSRSTPATLTTMPTKSKNNLLVKLRQTVLGVLVSLLPYSVHAQGTEPAIVKSDAEKTAEQAKDETVKMNKFEVSADQNQGYVGSETMSGSRAVAKVFDVPASVTVVTRDMIDDLGAVDPWQALSKSVSGVTTYASPGIFSGVLIRGFRAQFWAEDGATIASIGPSNNFNYEGMEVIKGPSALLYGPFGAYGGYVNLMPKWANADPIDKLELSVGTDAFYSSMLDYGLVLNKAGTLQARLVVGYLNYNRPGWPTDYTHTFTLAPSLTYDISSKVKVKTRLEWNNRKWLFSVSPLNPVTLQPMVGFTANQFFPDAGNTDRDLITQTELLGALSDEWSFRMQFQTEADHTNQVSGAFTSPTPKVPLDGPLTISESRADYYYKQFTIDMTATWDSQEFAPGAKNHLVTGVTMNNWNDNYRFNAASNQAVLYPQYNQAPYTNFYISSPLPASAYDTIILNQNNLYQPYNSQWLGGVMGTDTVDLMNGKLKLIAGIRYNYDERYFLSFTGTAPPNNNANTLTGNTPSVAAKSTVYLHRYGAIYQLNKQVEIYFGHDEGYLNVPALLHFDGSAVLPESGRNNEFGLKFDGFQALGGTFFGSIAYFKLQVENKWRGDPDHPGFYVSDGFQKNNGWDGQVSYTTNNNKFTAVLGAYRADGPSQAITGLRAVYAPKFTSNLWMRYNITNTIAVGGGAQHQGNTLDAYDVEASKPFTSYDLFCEYKQKLSKHELVVYRLGVTNLADTTNTYLLVNSTNAYTQDQRQVKLTATYVW